MLLDCSDKSREAFGVGACTDRTAWPSWPPVQASNLLCRRHVGHSTDGLPHAATTMAASLCLAGIPIRPTGGWPPVSPPAGPQACALARTLPWFFSPPRARPQPPSPLPPPIIRSIWGARGTALCRRTSVPLVLLPPHAPLAPRAYHAYLVSPSPSPCRVLLTLRLVRLP